MNFQFGGWDTADFYRMSTVLVVTGAGMEGRAAVCVGEPGSAAVDFPTVPVEVMGEGWQL